MKEDRVSNFRFLFDQGKTLLPNLLVDPTLDLFRGVNAENYREYVRSDSAGFSWFFEKEEFNIFKSGIRIFGLPTHNNRFVVAIYPTDDNEFSEPRNAVLYNANGTLKKRLKPPELLSNLARSRKKFMSTDYTMRLYFDTVGIKRENLGQLVTYLRIAFDRDYWEDHELDVETGEFKGMLGSGMR
jgi:hypothetical protein